MILRIAIFCTALIAIALDIYEAIHLLTHGIAWGITYVPAMIVLAYLTYKSVRGKR